MYKQDFYKMTIEERAKEYIKKLGVNLTPTNRLGRLQGYIKGATEQRKIDTDKACALVEELVECIVSVLEANFELDLDVETLKTMASKSVRKAMEDKE